MATPDTAIARWTDSKRYLWLLGALTITLPLHAAWLALSTGWHVFWWFGRFSSSRSFLSPTM